MKSGFKGMLINVAATAMTGAALLLAAGGSADAASKIVAKISLGEQRMRILIDGRTTYVWKVSTAGRGYVTPRGAYKPTRMHEMWYSKKYDNAPMPHSVFFNGGYAVHATNHISRLGRPASHGCVRLHPDNAANFYELVRAYGPSNTSIVIVK
ncbi:L,D-transpeptidase [Aminobacter sp. AP02]|uniref:L,D-transpeptidase n=1 Tax=Aminobacter sp. AP02 TaxID=2135737 RepID=UPI000D6B3525|nr:L,D-transpeptidase [Aminobacter sp. AP02]PWK64961.1 L,D-transpeptidase-like protein [Aminobacter sp. AP02]